MGNYIYRPQRSWGKVIFSEACVKNSVHRVGRAWQWGMCGGGGMHGRGCAWWGVCMAGGMHGRRHAWQGVCMAGGMHDRRHAWQGACMAGGMHGGGHAWKIL